MFVRRWRIFVIGGAPRGQRRGKIGLVSLRECSNGGPETRYLEPADETPTTPKHPEGVAHE